ncbi:OmpP1/FadL family transporter [Microbulbifer sp. TYP-18]|uniref:OmpP1/FadL family transporter n=1 Tax=Microbulbifer sp. TYP-18 TaxID=3230024 RepID=UPI0034C6273E
MSNGAELGSGTRKLLIYTALTSTLTATQLAFAGGLLFWEMGTPTLGTAGAGWAAMPEDASTAFTNPAGTVWRESTEIMASGQLLYGHLDFSDGGESNVPGNDGGNAIEWFPGGGFFAAGRLNENFGWGFSVSGNFGGSVAYDSQWKGRRFVRKVDLLSGNIMPSLSWRASDRLSLGLGFILATGYYRFESSPRAGILPGDASLRYDDTQVSPGGSLGVIYKPTSDTVLGLTYTSTISWDFNYRLQLKNFGPLFGPLAEQFNGRNLRINVDVPQTLTASVQQRLSPTATVYANLNWQHWSEFGYFGLEIDNPAQVSVTLNRNYKDTWHGAIGIRHKFDSGTLQDWSLSAGIAYDSGMVNTENRTADLVTDAAWRLGFGGQKELCYGLRLDLGYTLLWFGDTDIDQTGRPPFNPRLQGTYKNYSVNFFGASLQRSF